MENPSFEIIVLKVRNICCPAYQKRLKKELSKLDGVYSITINPEKSIVSVTGKVDANLLVKIITAKTGKYAEVACINKNPTKEHHNDDGFQHYEYVHKRLWNDNQSSYRNHKDSCFCENISHKMQEQEEEQKCEDYVPPNVDDRICRDYYCRIHMRRTIIRDSVPPGESSWHFGHFPHHTSRPIHVSNQYGPRWFMEEPPPAAYGRFCAGRPMPGLGCYGSFGDEHVRDCTIM